MLEWETLLEHARKLNVLTYLNQTQKYAAINENVPLKYRLKAMGAGNSNK